MKFNKSRRIAAAIVMLVALGFLIYVALPQEPKWHGLTVSQWLSRYGTTFSPSTDTDGAENAMRYFGTNALPILIREIGKKHSPVTLQIVTLLRIAHIPIKFEFPEVHRENALRAFETLGRNATPALPKLREYLRDPQLSWDAQEAIDNVIGYRPSDYINEAIQLQNLGKDAAIKLIATRAMHLAEIKDEPNRYAYSNAGFFILCRMLFAQRAGGQFRRPATGTAVFLGGTDYPDWPLDPIEVVDGVPFVIARPGVLAGHAETPAMYVNYCVSNCDWSTFRWEPKSEQQIQRALDQLLKSSKWRKPVDSEEREFLERQTR